jgi:hypothetical protein
LPAWIESLRPIHHRCLVRGATGDDGGYRLEHVPVGAVIVEAEPGDAAQSAEQRVHVREAAVERCDFRLAAAGEIRGRLVDRNGAPLASWDVRYDPVGGGRGGMATTDAAGAFQCEGLDAATYDLAAMPAGIDVRVAWVKATGVPKGTNDLELRTLHVRADGARFRGRALGAGGGAADSAVLLLTPVGDVQGHYVPLRLAADGAFATATAPPGSYRVAMRIGEHGGVDLGEQTIAGGADVELGDVRVAPAGVLELRFVAPDGRVGTASELRVFGPAATGGAVFESAPGGLWRSRPLSAGTYTLFAWGEDFARLRQQVVVAGDRTTVTDVPVEPAARVRFVLRLLEPAGEPVRASLRVTDAAGKYAGSANDVLVEPSGGFTFTRGFVPGRYDYEGNARPDGSTVRGSFVATGGHVTQVEVSLPR